MKKYLRTLYVFWNTSFAVQMEYQLNFIVELVAMIGTLTGSIFILSLFFRQDNQIASWSWEAALIVQGLYTVLDGITNTFLRPNLTEIVNYVREGTLDFVLLKPIDSQYVLSFRTLSPAGIPEILLGISITLWASIKSGVELNLLTIFVGVTMIIMGIIILYSLWFLVAASSIWFVKTWNATEVLRALLAAGRFPIEAYPTTLRFIFTLIIPIAFLTTVPAKALLGEAKFFILFLGICVSSIFLLASRLFWKYALRYYTSASS